MKFLSNIVNQSYSPEELRACLRLSDVWRFKLNNVNLEDEARDVSKFFFTSNSAIRKLDIHSLFDKQIFCPGTIYDQLCLRRTDQITKTALRRPILNRNDEIQQLLQILAVEQKCRIFNTDIASYFESVPFSNLIVQLESDGIRNNSALNHLKALNSYLLSHFGYPGLPRGLAISSTLADYALHNFDHHIFNLDTVVYYTRYVDDICVVHFDDPERIRAFLDQHLPYPSLKLNSEKTATLQLPSSDSLNFLGYNISLNRPQIVKISDKKLCKAKSRIVLTLRAFIAECDFWLLTERFQFLTGTVCMRKVGRRLPVCSGYSYAYRLCTEVHLVIQLKDLDAFLQRILSSKRFYLGRKLRQALSPEQLATLKGVSFERAHKNRITYKMDAKTVAKVKNAWRYLS